MKIFTKRCSTLFLFISLFAVSLQAATIEVVTPDNADSSAAEIKATFGDLIDVTVDDIEDFYLSTWVDHPYDSTCYYPDANVIQMNNNSAQFQWTLPSGGTAPTYIHYLRLSNGEIQSSFSSSGSATINIPNDLYLVIFQTKCGDELSAADIVIIDKPVMLNGAPCDCKEYKDVWDEPFPPVVGNDVNNNGITDYPWPPEDEGDYYCKVVFDQENIISSLRFHINYEDGTPSSIGAYEDCLENVVAEWNGTFLGAVNDENAVLGTFLFATNNSLTFEPISEDLSGHIYLRRCKNKPKPGKPRIADGQSNANRNDVIFKSLNNPFSNFTTIQYQLPTDQNTSILLYNVLGKEIEQIKAPSLTSKGMHQMNLDLSNLSNGIYFCILKTDTKILSIKLQKTN